MARLAIVNGRMELVDCDVNEPPAATTPDPVKVDSVSVSQVNEYERCPRRWFLRKVRRVAVPEGNKKAALTGSEIHRLIELYFRGTPVSPNHEHALKAQAAINNLPCAPGPGVEVEKRFKVQDPDLPKFTGIIDWVWVDED